MPCIASVGYQVLLLDENLSRIISQLTLPFLLLSLSLLKVKTKQPCFPHRGRRGSGNLGVWDWVAKSVLGNAEGQLLIVLCRVGPEAPCFSGETVTSASPLGAGCHFGLCPSTGSGKMATAKKKKGPLALWGRWRRKKRCSFEEITGIQWLPFFGLMTCRPYTRGPSLELPGTNSPRGGWSSQAPKSPQVYAALFYLSTLSDYCKGKPCRKLCSLKLKVGIYYSCLGLQGGSDLLWDLSPRRAQNLAEGVQFIERKWKWSRSVMSDSLWPHGL